MVNPRHLKILHQGIKAWNKWRDEHPKIKPDLSEADLSELDLYDANFRFTNLERANLSHANLDADFTRASLKYANLTGANLRSADLAFADLTGARLDGADVTNAWMGGGVFGFNDFSAVKGLRDTAHIGPSILGVETLYRSKGKIPEYFLREAGIPENLITYLPSLLSDPIQFYSCFISYSSKDLKFAERLYDDLQYGGVRCWLASEDLKVGEKMRVGIDESIRFHDKLLLVLSKHSVASDWVEQEVETALTRERSERRIVLFPIKLDDAVMKIEIGWPALIKNTRNIGDFCKWKQHDSYQKAFERLLRDLKAEEKKS